jgi:hypothetical protein
MPRFLSRLLDTKTSETLNPSQASGRLNLRQPNGLQQ